MDDRLVTIQDRVDYWRDACEPLGLGHWRVKVKIVENPDGSRSANAAVKISAQYDSAEIEFAEEALETLDDDEIDEAIVHELMHIVFRDFWGLLTDQEGAFSAGAWNLYMERLEHETEGVIDRTARAIVMAHRLPHEDVVQFEDTDKESN